MTTPSSRSLPPNFFDDAAPFKIDGMYCKLIPLTKGRLCIVELSDYGSVAKWTWKASECRGKFYAARCIIRGDGRKGTVFMHRQILGLEHGDERQGDHREPSETLNNTRMNLRIATLQQNRCNLTKPRTNTSGVKGVTRDGKFWKAQVAINGATITLGRRKTLEEAADLYATGAARYHGQFARTA